MSTPTLVVSDPPHGEVDLEAAAEILQLDVFATRLKAVFPAPEIMEATDADGAAGFAATLGRTGFDVVVVPGEVLAEVPWPAPVTALVLDSTSLRVTMGMETLAVPASAEVLGVRCRPPHVPDRSPTADLERAIASGHGPTIAEALQRRSMIDLHFYEGSALQRATVVPDLLKLDEDGLVKDLMRRMPGLRLDERLLGVRPRAPFAHGRAGGGADAPERRRYSFGTMRLYRALEAIAPELRGIPQYELGSRLSWALSPLRGVAGAR